MKLKPINIKTNHKTSYSLKQLLKCIYIFRLEFLKQRLLDMKAGEKFSRCRKMWDNKVLHINFCRFSLAAAACKSTIQYWWTKCRFLRCCSVWWQTSSHHQQCSLGWTLDIHWEQGQRFWSFLEINKDAQTLRGCWPQSELFKSILVHLVN